MFPLKKRTLWLSRLRRWAGGIKRDTYALWLAARDRRTPWYAKIIAILVVGYAISPIDLIPDFIPVLGYLDDAILVPLGIMLAIRLIPKPLLAELRGKAQARIDRRSGYWAAALIIALWALALLWLMRYVSRLSF
ncbi:YkvA family protein [Brenneria populi subsp. brevivirga]|uniref:YkvA family protein n=1 Tax=Brenneria populi TaxID=1505588 RepID=UPI002E185478|nr:YkvA family protein [Brenneria populi subsp. brevivirga]